MTPATSIARMESMPLEEEPEDAIQERKLELAPTLPETARAERTARSIGGMVIHSDDILLTKEEIIEIRARGGDITA